MNDNENTFHYVYSAKQQEEIKRIRDKYITVEEDKVERLRKLDQSTKQLGSVVSLSIGILGSLVLGAGMSCCMVWTDTLMIPGIIVGIAGMIMCGVAYPIYKHLVKKKKEEVAQEIIKLADELLK